MLYKFCPKCYASSDFSASTCQKCGASLLKSNKDECYLDKLIWALFHPNRETALRAACLIGELGSKAETAVPALINAFNEENRDPYLLAAIVASLRKIGSKDAMDFLKGHSNHHNIIVRQAINRAFNNQ